MSERTMMMTEDKRNNVDLLIEEFWRRGYLTLSRRFGTYLPEPGKVGPFEVDIIARYKKDYAIGINLSKQDFNGSNLTAKLLYLATRHTKFSNKKVRLFIGAPSDCLRQLKIIIGGFDPEIRKNIKLFPIVDKSLPTVKRYKKNTNVLFS